jgi:hypothetical protein
MFELNLNFKPTKDLEILGNNHKETVSKEELEIFVEIKENEL